MRRILIITGLFFTTCANAQSKKDVQDWLIYYLQKYADRDYSSYKAYLHKETPNDPYVWEAYDYKFEGDLFVVRKIPQGKPDTYRDYTDYKINMSRLVKCEVDSIQDKVGNLREQVNITLVFKEPEFIGGKLLNRPIREYDSTGNEVGSNGFRVVYKINCFDGEAVSIGMATKFKKAFEAYAKLVGAIVVKELF